MASFFRRLGIMTTFPNTPKNGRKKVLSWPVVKILKICVCHLLTNLNPFVTWKGGNKKGFFSLPIGLWCTVNNVHTSCIAFVI